MSCFGSFGGERRSRSIEPVALVAGVAAATIFGRFSWFTEPFGISVDESTYMALGDIVARGGIPYQDALDRKPPGVFWMFAAMGRVFGPWNINAVHGVAFAMTLLLCLAAARLCQRITPAARAGSWAAIAFALYSACFTREIISFNAEYPMLIACAGTALCLTWSRPGEPLWRSGIAAWAGAALAALSTIFKQYGILVCLPMAVVSVAIHIRADRAGHRSPWPRLAVTLLAGAVGLGLVFVWVAYWFWTVGALKVLWRWAVLDGFHYARAGWSVSSLKLDTIVTFLALAVAWLPLWLGISRAGPWRKSPAFQLVLAGAAGAAATTLLSGRSFAHYYLPLAWFCAVLAVPGLLDLCASRRRRILIAVVAFAPLGFFAVFNTARDAFWAGAKFNRARQRQLDAVAIWIRQHVPADETITVWGTASQLYPMSERGSGTRDVFADFVSGRQPGFDSAARQPMPGALDDFLTDLDRKRPAVFVDTSSAGINDYEYFPVTSFPELSRYLSAKYCLVATIQGVRLWNRRGAGISCRK